MKDQGILQKYIITKVDGSPIDEGAKYFVLRLDDGGGDPIHIDACRKAVITYAYCIQDHLPVLAKELMDEYAKDPGNKIDDIAAVIQREWFDKNKKSA